MNYSSLLTVTGQAKVAAALQPGGTPLTITHIALGDGGGAAVVPSVHRAELLHEVHRQDVSFVGTHPTDPTQVRIQAVISPQVGGFWIREIGLYDTDGDLVVYGNHPETAKPLLADGAGIELIVRTHFAVSSTSAVTIHVDPSVVNATQEWVSQQLIWPNIGEKPQTFPSSAHTHHADDVNAGVLAVARIPKLGIAKINGLADALDGKADMNHTHTTADILDVHRARRFYFNQL